ncbi:MAG: hypothetical protein AB7S99_14460 [Pseudodonghicola sp.]
MIGLIALFLPLFLGGVLAVPIGRRCRKLGARPQATGRRRWKFLIRALGETLAVLVGVSFVLAKWFAAELDTLDGTATLPEFLNYMKYQMVLLSLLAVPAAMLAFRDGKESA